MQRQFNSSIEDVMSAKPQDPGPPANVKASSPVKKKILLVDDDSAIRTILLRLLVGEGYSVQTAANGFEALDLLARGKFDLISLDLNMPEMDGWETFEELAVREPLLPVIVITARANQLFPALAAGVGALLEKPLDFTRLLEEIPRLLEEPRQVRLARLAGRPSVFSYVRPGSTPPGGNPPQK